MSKEGMTSSLHCEVHADCFLWRARNCAPQTHSTDTNICADILQQDVWQKWPEKWHNGNLFHHHHNAPVHPLSVQEFLANNGMTVNLHSLDSGCGTLGFFFFFPFPKTEDGAGRKEISWHQHDSRMAGYVFRALNTGCYRMLSKMTQSLGLLNSVARGLL